MDVQVQRLEDWWVVVAGEEPVRTPAGTPVVSHHRELIDEVAADIAKYGSDPTAKTTMYSLQASYLDFGIPVKREALEENTASIWPDDLCVHRPASPEYDMPLLALWGRIDLDRAGFRDALRKLTLRQLMATMTAGQVLRTAVLGLKVVTTDRELVPMAMGACDRYFTSLGKGMTLSKGYWQVGGSSGRHSPTDMDKTYCSRTCCAGKVKDLAKFRERCALYPLFDKMRRWAVFPEEVER